MIHFQVAECIPTIYYQLFEAIDNMLCLMWSLYQIMLPYEVQIHVISANINLVYGTPVPVHMCAGHLGCPQSFILAFLLWDCLTFNLVIIFLFCATPTPRLCSHHYICFQELGCFRYKYWERTAFDLYLTSVALVQFILWFHCCHRWQHFFLFRVHCAYFYGVSIHSSIRVHLD